MEEQLTIPSNVNSTEDRAFALRLLYTHAYFYIESAKHQIHKTSNTHQKQMLSMSHIYTQDNNINLSKTLTSSFLCR